MPHRSDAASPSGRELRVDEEAHLGAPKHRVVVLLGTPLEVAFAGELQAEQRSATASLLAHETGVLAATTAFGKTVLGAWMIAQRGVSTLVLVHRRQLQEQWSSA